jgi:phosphate starvation-inducible membrane PsiE
MKAISFFVPLIWAQTAIAHHELTPLREAMIDGHSHEVGGATLWLAGAAVAMVVALVAVQRSVFRKR